MTDLETRFTLAAADRLGNESLDIEQLLAGATRDGRRIKTRRYAVTALASAACVALLGAGITYLAPQPSASPDQGLDFAGQPSASATPTTQPPLETFEDGTAIRSVGDYRILIDHEIPVAVIGVPPEAAVPPEVRELIGDATLVPEPDGPAYLGDVFPSVTDWTNTSQVVRDIPGEEEANEPPETLFRIDVPQGWQCDEPADEKAGCTNGSAVLTIHQRDAAEHSVWSSDPDKGAPGTGVLVSDVHGDHFVSVQPTTGTPAEIQQLAEALAWVDGTPAFAD